MSMRDFDLAEVVFEDDRGISITIKDMRDYTLNTYQTWFIYNLQPAEDFDEIASRKSIYGEESESEFYKITEHNIVDLFNLQFNTAQLRSIKVPLP